MSKVSKLINDHLREVSNIQLSETEPDAEILARAMIIHVNALRDEISRLRELVEDPQVVTLLRKFKEEL